MFDPIRSLSERRSKDEQLYDIYPSRWLRDGEPVSGMGYNDDFWEGDGDTMCFIAPSDYNRTIPTRWLPEGCALLLDEAINWTAASLVWNRTERPALSSVVADMYDLRDRRTRDLRKLLHEITLDDLIGLYAKKTSRRALEAIGTLEGTGLIEREALIPQARALHLAKTNIRQNNYTESDGLGLVLGLDTEFHERCLPLDALPELVNMYTSRGCARVSQCLPHLHAYLDLRSESENIPDELLLAMVENLLP